MARLVPKRIVRCALAAASFVLFLSLVTPHLTARADNSPPAGTVTQLAQTLPNYTYTYPAGGHITSIYTAILADPLNHLLFETNAKNGVACPQFGHWQSYNADTLTPIASDCGPSPSGAPAGMDPQSGSLSSSTAVDSTDRLLFIPVSGDPDYISVLSEDSLAVVATYCVDQVLPSLSVVTNAASCSPSDPNQQQLEAAPPRGHIAGISWSRHANQIIVTTDSFDPHGSGQTSKSDAPGVVVTAYAIAGGVNPQLTLVWSAAVSGCNYALPPRVATATAHASLIESAVFVPCDLDSTAQVEQEYVSSSNAPTKVAVVKVQLSAVGCAPITKLCPTGTQTLTVAPGAASDFIFDSGSDRAFMPLESQSGLTVLTYDGAANPPAFLGRSAVGTLADGPSVGVGVDGATGRLYGVGPVSGLTLIDGRRTPVSVGTVYPQFAQLANLLQFPVLPPDQPSPFTRFVVSPQITGADGNISTPYFRIYADRAPVTTDPSINSVDGNTLTGPPPPGSALSHVYGGSARGYGVHSDYVGSYLGTVNNTIAGGNGNGQLGQGGLGVFSGTCVTGPLGTPPPPPAPAQECPVFGSGNRDLMFSAVDKLDINNGSTLGTAGAVEDPQSSTAQGYQTTTGGTWPAGEAICSAPGGAANPAPVDGYQGPSGQQAGGADQAHAQVHCADGNPPVARGWAANGANQIGASGIPSLAVGASSVTTSVGPPDADGAVTATTTSDARGITIQLPGGSISFGEVLQVASATANGKAGGASATRVVTISDVTLSVPGQQPQPLCPGVCASDQAVADQINNAFAGYLHVIVPAPDDRYYNHVDLSTGKGQGSPGGYTAAVEAGLGEQYGDAQFNGMTAGERSFLPGMRIVLYDDGGYQLDREILDLAGAEVDAEVGIQAFPAITGFAGANLTAAAVAAGVPGYSTTTPGQGGTQNTGAASSGGLLGAIGGLIERVFSGLQWLLRNPLEALQMLGAMALLGLPLLLIDRRRLWLRDVFGFAEAPT